jgi:hypothetical protein
MLLYVSSRFSFMWKEYSLKQCIGDTSMPQSWCHRRFTQIDLCTAIYSVGPASYCVDHTYSVLPLSFSYSRDVPCYPVLAPLYSGLHTPCSPLLDPPCPKLLLFSKCITTPHSTAQLRSFSNISMIVVDHQGNSTSAIR